MHPAYFEVRFRTDDHVGEWPSEFAVITAYATTGQAWSDEENEAADRELREHLGSLSHFVVRLSGYSPSTGHCEPGWAVAVPYDQACDIGFRFHQDAIYFVEDDSLSVSRCGERRKIEVGTFSERLD